MARFILLTGLMGSGKSYVADMLRGKRYTVVDSDSWAKQQYDDPDTFKFVVDRLGPMCLDEHGRIDLGYIKRYILRHDPEDRIMFTWGLATRVANGIESMFGSRKEIVFIEAAPTAQVGHVCALLGIETAIVVNSDEETRRQRLMTTREMSQDEIDAFDNLQDLDYIHQTYSRTHRDVRKIILDNDLSLVALNGRLMDIIEKDIQPTPEEKFALYERYLRESPEYCKQNAMCYSFYNLGGCNCCPFPCSQQDRNFERANREFMKEKKGNPELPEQPPSVPGEDATIPAIVEPKEIMDTPRFLWEDRLVTIGDQVWMNCNLQAPADPENGIFVADGQTYFTWDAAVREAKKYESLGFRLPTREDWDKLEKFCGVDASKKLKSTSGWKDDGNGTDAFGFNGKPSGWYSLEDFMPIFSGGGAYFWSANSENASQAYYWGIYCNDNYLREYCNYKRTGFSIRLVKDAVFGKKENTPVEQSSKSTGAILKLPADDGSEIYILSDKLVTIGDQVWMNCNLQAPADPEHGVYVVDGETYFTWDAAVSVAKKLEPLGFRLPTKEDWEKLRKFVSDKTGSSNKAGYRLKSSDRWDGIDLFGFNAIPAGYYIPEYSEVYYSDVYYSDYGSYFWTATPNNDESFAYAFSLYSGILELAGYYDKRVRGLSVRLMKDAD